MAGAHGFPKAVRLRRRREFLSLQRDGQRRHTPAFVVVRRPAATAMSRLGVTVSARVGGAVARNRVKRHVREFFRQRRADLPAVIDVVVIAKAGAPKLTYAEVASELDRALDVAR